MKNRIVKQLLGISLATVLFAQMPMLSFAEPYDISKGNITITATADDVHTVEYTDISGQRQTATGDTDPVVTGSTTSNEVIINAYGGDAYVKFDNATIDMSNKNWTIAVKVMGDNVQNDVHIELNGSNILKGGKERAGLQDELAGELIITDVDNNGSLTATGGFAAAAIGGGKNAAGTDITISGGEVTATGGFAAAAIGGGQNGAGTNITISGGEVTATGGFDAAAIGGGDSGAGTNIKISGGEVTATGGYDAAAIGGGDDGTARGITICGGTVTATGGASGAGIGGFTLDDEVIISGAATVNVAGGGEYDVYFSEAGTGNVVAGLCGAGAAIGTAGSCDFSTGEPIYGTNVDPDISGLYNTGSINTYPAGTTIAQMSTTQPITIIGTIEDPNAVIPPNPSGQIDKVTVNDNNNNAGDSNNNVTSDTAPVDEAHAFVASTDAKLQEHINKILALINSGKIEEANALIANGILLDTGRWYTFNKDTCALIEKASQLGIKVTLHFEYDHIKYSTTIPAKTTINPVSLCDVKGFVGFMNFYKYYGGFVRSN
ncbi:MAG: hypothetical protein K5877_09085 [Lachnospiraceae bacterium]|nr:hypothetical protein [Lachnospiraceae bacterium]